MKLSDYITECLAKEVKHVFVGNGGCVVHLLDSIDKNRNLKGVPCENEQGAAIAAEAYARVTAKMGVSIATSGPGMVNLIQGIACAYFDSIPCLFISGESPTAQLRGERRVRQMGFQEMDVIGIVRPLTKYAVLVTDPKKIRYEMEKLFFMARDGRPGPVLLDLPDDIQRQEINPAELEPYIPQEQARVLPASAIGQAIALIEQAHRPVVVVGGGVKLGNAKKLLEEFLRKAVIPFATTWATIDMFLDNTAGLIGNFGISANRAGNFAVQNADLIINLGSRLDTHQTGSKPQAFAPQAKKISVDIDETELNKNNGMQIDLKFNCDIKTFLSALNARTVRPRDLSGWKEKIRQWRIKYPICPREYYSQKEKVNPYVFMDELSRQTKDSDIIITDAGATLTWTMQGYKMRHRQMLFSAFNHSPMGYALPASIGAQFAAPKRQVICLIGDGGLQMNIQELETVVYNKLPIKIFVMNNSGYGIIKQTQDTWLNSRYVAADPGSGLGFPDFGKIAAAYGIKTEEIKNHKELKTKLKKALQLKGPVVYDIKVKSGEKIIPKLEFGRPIEDSSPLLPREEFIKNMLNE